MKYDKISFCKSWLINSISKNKMIYTCSVIITAGIVFLYAIKFQPDWKGIITIKAGQVSRNNLNNEDFNRDSIAMIALNAENSMIWEEVLNKENVSSPERVYIKENLQIEKSKDSVTITLHSHSKLILIKIIESLSSKLIEKNVEFIKPNLEFNRKKIETLKESIASVEEFLNENKKTRQSGIEKAIIYNTALEIKHKLTLAEEEFNPTNTFIARIDRIYIDEKPWRPKLKIIILLSLLLGFINGVFLSLSIPIIREFKE